MFAADNTKVLVCGVGAYREPSLILAHAANNAAEFATALELNDGCAIPPGNIIRLLDEGACKSAIFEALRRMFETATSEQVVIFYFSGHAFADNGRHYLLPVDSDPKDLTTSAITMVDIESAIGGRAARGIFFLLDCCHSAGFAEDAVSYFAKSGDQDFRLLISASKAGQPSIEFEKHAGSIFTRSLVDLLHGTKQAGTRPGILYFSDVFEFLHREMGEELEALGHPRTLQEPTFAGTYSKDPLLFVLRQLSLEQLERETPLYSSKFLRKRVRAAVGSLVILIATALLGYYTYLDHGEYVWHEASVLDENAGDYLTIYRGDPNYNWLSFPHRVVATDILSNGIEGAIRPGAGQVISRRFGATVDAPLFESLYPQWQVATATWRGDRARALRAAADLDILDNPEDSGFPEAAEALASFATPAQIESFTLLTPDKTDVAKPLLRSIATQDPDRAIADLARTDFSLTDDAFIERGAFRSVMDGLPARCDGKVATFLAAQAAFLGGDGSYEHTAWHWAALRTRCLFSDAVWRRVLLSKVSTPALLDNVPLFLGRERRLFVKRTRDAIMALASDLDRKTGMERYDRARSLWANLTALTLLAPDDLPPGMERFLKVPEGYLRLAAARALLAQSPTRVSPLARYAGHDLWVTSALIQRAWYDDAIVRAAVAPWVKSGGQTKKEYVGDALTYLLRSIRLAHAQAGYTIAGEIMRASPLAEVRIEALRTRSALRPPSQGPERFPAFGGLMAEAGLGQGSQDPVGSRQPYLRPGTWRWYVTHDRNALAKMLDAPASAIDHLTFSAVGITISENNRQKWRRDLGVADRRFGAAGALAMVGSKDDLIGLLTSSDINLRNTVAYHAVYNPALDEAVLAQARQIFGSKAAFYVERQLRLRDSIARQAAALPPLERRIYLAMLYWDPDQVGSGLRMWLRDGIEALDGVGPDPDDEVGRSNGPPPLSLASVPPWLSITP